MTWEDDSGRHEGWTAAVTKDHRLASTHNGRGVLVEGITGNYPEDDLMKGWEQVPADDVTGWQLACSCGWKGAGFLSRRPGESTFAPGDAEDELFYPEWRAHIEPSQARYALEDAFWESKKAAIKVDEAVARAREAGVSWNDIGMATHMTKQAAHERWS
jgi:hypothetical protein